MDKILSQLVDKLKKAYGDGLVSVILYGSAAVGDHHASYSDLNIFCVLNKITPTELGASETVFRWWRELGNPSPLLLSAEEVGRSTDCFPIEFHDMEEHRRVLYGQDVIAGLSVGDIFYRAQVEHELRAKLLRLRQKAAGVLSDREMLLRLLTDSVSTFCILTRHALRLLGHGAPNAKRDIIALARERFGTATRAFDTLLDLREEKIKAKDTDPARLFEDYLKEIETVVHAVDALQA
jgi:predicted nucleotidyltransferase